MTSETDLLEIVQGEAGFGPLQGLVMQKDIRVQEMELHADSIAINPSALLVKLDQPVDATARLNRTGYQPRTSTQTISAVRYQTLNVVGQTAIIEPLYRWRSTYHVTVKWIFTADTHPHTTKSAYLANWLLLP